MHQNHKGKWYPVCNNPDIWAKLACEAEIGTLHSPPQISNAHDAPFYGPFISNKGNQNSEPIIIDQCSGPVYVKCPPVQCGQIKKPHDPHHEYHKRAVKGLTHLHNETVGIVGGTDCSPHQWPFVVAIFKNGKLHCGGAIKSEQWIITAAHCFHTPHKHYYEVRAGLLRQRSYNPEVQVIHVEKVYVYPGYNQQKMIEDLALVKLAVPLKYNRYVRPICLPAPGRSSTDNNWKMGPSPGTICSVMGWGSLAEDGPHRKYISRD